MDPIIKVLINAFIIIMLFWMIFWDSEKQNPIKKWFVPIIQGPMIWLGLSHDWKMFSPNPTFYNIWPMIKMYKSEDDFIVWEQGDTSKMSILEKIKYKKYLKFYFDVARQKAGIHSKIDFIEYLLARHNIRESCIKVEVYRVNTNITKFNVIEIETPETYKKLVYTYTPVNQILS
jgi:hypothetical protein